MDKKKTDLNEMISQLLSSNADPKVLKNMIDEAAAAEKAKSEKTKDMQHVLNEMAAYLQKHYGQYVKGIDLSGLAMEMAPELVKDLDEEMGVIAQMMRAATALDNAVKVAKSNTGADPIDQFLRAYKLKS